MNFSPKVSIVIPVYNGSNYLREAIDSALAQTYKNVEVIVINDGSSDEGQTEAIAKSYGNKIRYFHKKNGGVASALNLGIEKMTGEYFSWLSHDDVYYPHKIEKQIEYLSKRNNINIVTYCDCHIIDGNSNIITASKIKDKYLNNEYLTILSTSIGGCSLLIPKLCFDSVGFFNEKLKYTQDNEMWLRIAKAGFVFEYIPEFLLKRRVHTEQGSVTIQNHCLSEGDSLCLFAINYIGDDIIPMFDDLIKIIIRKKYHNAFHVLINRYCKDERIKFIRLKRAFYMLYFTAFNSIFKHPLFVKVALYIVGKKYLTQIAKR